MFIRQWCALEHENNVAWMKPFDEVYPDPDEACPERTEGRRRGLRAGSVEAGIPAMHGWLLHSLFCRSSLNFNQNHESCLLPFIHGKVASAVRRYFPMHHRPHTHD